MVCVLYFVRCKLPEYQITHIKYTLAKSISDY